MGILWERDFIEVDEAYSSQASFLDNADANAAANLRGKVVDVTDSLGC